MRSFPPAVPYGKYGSPNPSAISARIVLPGFIPLGISCYLSASETGGCRLPDAGPDNSFALLFERGFRFRLRFQPKRRAVIVFKKSGQSAEEVFRRFLLSGQRGQIHDRTRNRRDFPTALRDVSAKRSVQRARSVRCSSVPAKSIRVRRHGEAYPEICRRRQAARCSSPNGLDAERSQRVDDRRGEIAVQNGPFVLVYDKSVIDVSVVMVDGSASRKAPDYLDAVPQTVIGVYLRFDPLVASDDDRRPVDIEEQNVP